MSERKMPTIYSLVPVETLEYGEYTKMLDEYQSILEGKAVATIKLPGTERFYARHVDPSDVGLSTSTFTITTSAAGTATYINQDVPDNKVFGLFGFALLTPDTKITKITVYKNANVMAVYRIDELKGFDKPVFLAKQAIIWGPKETIKIEITTSDATTEEVVPIMYIEEPYGETITA